MYTLRFPFIIPKENIIDISDFSNDINGLSISLEKRDHFYVLTIKKFPSESSAKNYIGNIWAGLMWLLLNRNIPLKASFEIQKNANMTDPIQAGKNLLLDRPIDINIDAGLPAVYRTEKRIAKCTAFPMSITQTNSTEDILSFFSEGITYPASSKVILESKLKLAFELYGAHFTESSVNAQFLTLIMCLEALKIEKTRTQPVLNLLNKWKTEVDELIKAIQKDSEDENSLVALRKSLLFQETDSIRRQIRSLVLETLLANGDEDAKKTAKTAVKAYDLRSELVHEGKLDPTKLNTIISDLRNLVKRILRIKFLQIAKQDNNL